MDEECKSVHRHGSEPRAMEGYIHAVALEKLPPGQVSRVKTQSINVSPWRGVVSLVSGGTDSCVYMFPALLFSPKKLWCRQGRSLRVCMRVLFSELSVSRYLIKKYLSGCMPCPVSCSYVVFGID